MYRLIQYIYFIDQFKEHVRVSSFSIKQKNKNSDFSLHSVQSYSSALAFLQDEKSVPPKAKASPLLKRIYIHFHQRYIEAEVFPDQNIHFHKFDLQKAHHISPAKAKVQPSLL